MAEILQERISQCYAALEARLRGLEWDANIDGWTSEEALLAILCIAVARIMEIDPHAQPAELIEQAAKWGRVVH